MEKYNVKFKKRFGQNFLKDDRVVNRIVEISGITDKDLVVEVGPGGAILTKKLADKARKVLAYEIDNELEETLLNKLKDYCNVDIKFQDFLQSDINSDIKKYEYENIYFISNVPYYITTPILMKLIESKIPFKKIIMMVQKEVGDRFSSGPGTRDYSSISVFLNYYYNVRREFNVSRKEFVPEPNVDSVVISLETKRERYSLKNEELFHKLVRDAFQFKRKNLRNNLRSYDLVVVSSVLSSYGFDLSVRAEQLDVKVFVDIANSLA